ncbi:hypothetical protein BKA70DRAFT_598888 [Coprinopsis sp. MPI-PUGE-AT-0042]|nr:hypothetical protein BKA70DRAFT_598888 [Coprinopsis sp. MPI-PUGE-AT-0042]
MISHTFDGPLSWDTGRPNFKSNPEDRVARKMKDGVSTEGGGDFQQSIEDYEGKGIVADNVLSDAELAKLFRRIKFEVQSDITAKIEPSGFSNTFLSDLDLHARHQPRGFDRLPNHTGGHDSIYVKKIDPTSHGYLCPNTCPERCLVCIGDVGELTSTGFTVLANLSYIQLPSLQSLLASTEASGVLNEPQYLSDGQSITSGVSVEEISYFPGTTTLHDIGYQYPGHASRGAVTSPAQPHALNRSENRRLRRWLCEHGMELLQHVDPGRTDPLCIVTGIGKGTSSLFLQGYLITLDSKTNLAEL